MSERPAIDTREAAAALSDIDQIAQRVRQSLVYRLASLMMVMWGALTAAGYLVSFVAPRYAGWAWIAVYIVGFAGSVAIGASQKASSGNNSTASTHDVARRIVALRSPNCR